MELVVHAASVHVNPSSRARHERCRAMLDGAGIKYKTNDTLDVPRETAVETSELPQLAVRRPAMDVVFASYETLVEWNDAGLLAEQIERTVSRAVHVGDKELLKENMRLRAARRLTRDACVQTDAADFREVAAEALASSAAAEREADAMRAKAAAARSALCKIMGVVPIFIEVASVLAE